MLDPDVCYRALKTRDARFDGRLFVAVTTTGIYCRPVCPASLARRENCRFFPSAAAAQEAGFRPCLRCRPETAPEHGAWHGTSNTVSRGLGLIAEGELDGEGASVDALAERLGVGERQLRRLFQQHLGASPIAVAQTRRVLFAKQLIHETKMPMSEIALASGFGSVRRFNETFQGLYARPPSALRRKTSTGTRRANGAKDANRTNGAKRGHGASHASDASAVSASGVTVRLRYRAPYDWAAMLAFLRERALDGVEHVTHDSYARSVFHDGQRGTIEISHAPKHTSLVATIRFPSVQALGGLVARIRRLFDLSADVLAIGAHLGADPLLAPLVAARPGLRTAGAWDGFELAVRAVLGQQVTLAHGRELGTKLVRLCAKPLELDGSDARLTAIFPTPADVLAANLNRLGMPSARRRTLENLAEAALADPALFQPRGSLEETLVRLVRIGGIGDWTAQYIALRAAREPDAFPASDIGLMRGAPLHGDRRPSARELLKHAERWRPFRAYAAEHLWAADAAAREKARSKP